jgi:hypothetical protein
MRPPNSTPYCQIGGRIAKNVSGCVGQLPTFLFNNIAIPLLFVKQLCIFNRQVELFNKSATAERMLNREAD